MAAAVLLAPGGCSLGADEEAPRAGGAPAGVAAVVNRLERATVEQDYATICDDVLTGAARRRAGGADCARLMRSAGREIEAPAIEITGISVHGERATVRVRTTAAGQQRVADSLQLRRGPDGWRIEGLGASGARRR
jgi:hypothetical protein